MSLKEIPKTMQCPRSPVRRLAFVLLSWTILPLFVLCAETELKPDKLVELQGRVRALPGSTNLQFRVESGPTYKLVPSRDAQALFADTNLHSKILIVKGRVDPKLSTLEVIGNLHEARAGRIYELYYYCDICSIETSFPGLCLCCREDVVLRERERQK